jgi:cell division protein FtsI (penicillin-binding protein 3)
LLQTGFTHICDTVVLEQAPFSKTGKYKELQLVLDKLEIPFSSQEEKPGEWVFSKSQKNNIEIKTQTIYNNNIPNTIGMGAKDAIFLLENRGLQVRLSGRGKVVSQSPASGKINKGDIIQLQLQ